MTSFYEFDPTRILCGLPIRALVIQQLKADSIVQKQQEEEIRSPERRNKKASADLSTSATADLLRLHRH